MKLVAVSFLVPVRFFGNRIEIARVGDGFDISPGDQAVSIRRGLQSVSVPASNCALEYEHEPAPLEPKKPRKEKTA